MKVIVSWPSDGHTRYSPTAFDKQVGKPITVNFNAPEPRFDEHTGLPINDVLQAKAMLLAAFYNPVTDAVEFTLDILDPEQAVVLAAYVATGAFKNLTIVEQES